MAGNSERGEVCLLSSFNEKEKKIYADYIKSIPGGVFINSSFYIPDCTVVICKTPSRGEKYLCGCIAGKPVLTPSYITNSLNTRKWAKKSSFEWCNQGGGNKEEKLLKSLPRRCKAYAHKNNGKSIFENWKVLLHIPDKIKRSAYKRLLEAGGAKILNLTPPFHVQLKYVINYAFATKESVRDLTLLSHSQFQNILYPEYISEYVVHIEMEETPLMRTFKHFKKVASPKKTTKSPTQPTIVQMLTKKRKSDEVSPSKKRFCPNSVLNGTVNVDAVTASATNTSHAVNDILPNNVHDTSSSNTVAQSVVDRVYVKDNRTSQCSISSSSIIYHSPNVSTSNTHTKGTPLFSSSGIGIYEGSPLSSKSLSSKLLYPASTALDDDILDIETPIKDSMKVSNSKSALISQESVDSPTVNCLDEPPLKNTPENDMNPFFTLDDEDTEDSLSAFLVSCPIIENKEPSSIDSIKVDNNLSSNICTESTINGVLTNLVTQIDKKFDDEKTKLVSSGDKTVKGPIAGVSLSLLDESVNLHHDNKIEFVESVPVSVSHTATNCEAVIGSARISYSITSETVMNNSSRGETSTISHKMSESVPSKFPNKSTPFKNSSTNENIPFTSPGGIVLDNPDVRKDVHSDIKCVGIQQPDNSKSTQSSNEPILIDDSPLKKFMPSRKNSYIDLSDDDIAILDGIDNDPSVCILLDTPKKKSNANKKDGVAQDVIAFIDLDTPKKNNKKRESQGDKKNLLHPSVALKKSAAKADCVENDKSELSNKSPLDENVLAEDVLYFNSQVDNEMANLSNSFINESKIEGENVFLGAESLTPSCKINKKSDIVNDSLNEGNMSNHNLFDEDHDKSWLGLSDVVDNLLKDRINFEKEENGTTIPVGRKSISLNQSSMQVGKENSEVAAGKEDEFDLRVGVGEILKPCNDICDLSKEGDVKPGSYDDCVGKSIPLKVSSNDINEDNLEVNDGTDISAIKDCGDGRKRKPKDFSDYVTLPVKGKSSKRRLEVTNTKSSDKGTCVTPTLNKSLNPNSSISNDDIKKEIKKEDLSDSFELGKKWEVERTPTKRKIDGKRGKIQSLINFTRSPNKNAAIQQEFDENPPLIKEENITSPCTSKSRFGRERKHKKFSSDYVTPTSSKRKLKSRSADITKFMKNSVNNDKHSKSISYLNVPTKDDGIESPSNNIENQSSVNLSDNIISVNDDLDDCIIIDSVIRPSNNISVEKVSSKVQTATNKRTSNILVENVSSKAEEKTSINVEAKNISHDNTLVEMISSKSKEKMATNLEKDDNHITFIKGLSKSAEKENDINWSAQVSNKIVVTEKGDSSEEARNYKQNKLNKQANAVNSTLILPDIISSSGVKTRIPDLEIISIDSSSESQPCTPCKNSSKLTESSLVIQSSAESIFKIDSQSHSNDNLLDSDIINIGSQLLENEKLNQDELCKLLPVTINLLKYLPSLKLLPYCRKETKHAKVLERASFSKSVENMVEANMDQGNQKDALKTIKENTSSFYYPKAKTIALLFQNLLMMSNDSQSILLAAEIRCFLDNLVLWHPVKDIVDVYFLSLQKPVEDEDESINGTVLPIEFILEIVSDVSDALKVDPDERSKNHKSQLLLLKYIVNIIHRNFLEQFSDESVNVVSNKKVCLDKLRKTLIWKIIWGVCQDPGVNKNLKDLVHVTLTKVAESDCEEDCEISQMLITMISLVACCCSIKDTINSGNGYSTCSTNFVSEICLKCEQVLFSDNVKLSSKSWFLNYLCPGWLCYRLLEFLLIRYSDELVDVPKRHLLRKSLSLEKIVHCYFFLYPKLGGSSKKSARYTPLKDIKNIVNTKSTSSPSKKLSKTKIDKRNIRGETQLQVACIKNNPQKVKELLALGADSNTKDNAGWTPLHEACNYGYIDCVVELLKCKELDIFATNSEGISVLHDAVQGNHIKIVERLLDRGGKKLLDLKTKADLSANDLAATEEMKDLLINLSGKNALKTKNIDNSDTQPPDVEVKLNSKLYENIDFVCKEDAEEYLFLLMMLLHIYTPAEQNTMEQDILVKQFKMLELHMKSITQMSVRAKLYLKSISRILLS